MTCVFSSTMTVPTYMMIIILKNQNIPGRGQCIDWKAQRYDIQWPSPCPECLHQRSSHTLSRKVAPAAKKFEKQSSFFCVNHLNNTGSWDPCPQLCWNHIWKQKIDFKITSKQTRELETKTTWLTISAQDSLKSGNINIICMCLWKIGAERSQWMSRPDEENVRSAGQQG